MNIELKDISLIKACERFVLFHPEYEITQVNKAQGYILFSMVSDEQESRENKNGFFIFSNTKLTRTLPKVSPEYFIRGLNLCLAQEVLDKYEIEGSFCDLNEKLMRLTILIQGGYIDRFDFTTQSLANPLVLYKLKTFIKSLCDLSNQEVSFDSILDKIAYSEQLEFKKNKKLLKIEIDETYTVLKNKVALVNLDPWRFRPITNYKYFGVINPTLEKFMRDTYPQLEF